MNKAEILRALRLLQRGYQEGGLCLALENLRLGGKISFHTEMMTRNLLYTYFANPKARNQSYWLNDELFGEWPSAESYSPRGKKRRKAIIADAIAFVESTGTVE